MDTTFACKFCEKIFISKRNCLMHEDWHTYKFSCTYCERKLKTANELDRHLIVHKDIISEKDGELNTNACPECEKTFCNKAYLKTHQKLIHNSKKPHSCNECSKSFKMLSNLKQHMNLHTKNKIFICTICSRTFSRSTTLKLHGKKHIGESILPTNEPMQIGENSVPPMEPSQIGEISLLPKKPSNIGENSVPFKEPSHIGEKSVPTTKQRKKQERKNMAFPCDECNRGFSAEFNLRYHKRMHSGKQLYTCKQCYKSYPNNTRLRAHKLTHLNQSLTCNECNSVLKTKESLRQHKRRMHKKVNDSSEDSTLAVQVPDHSTLAAEIQEFLI